MKRQIFFYVIFFIFAISLVSCQKKEKSSSESAVAVSSESDISTNQNTEDFSYLDLIKIKPGQKLVIKNPETFVQLYLLFNYDQKMWLKEVALKTNLANEPEKYLEAKRKEFYQSFGMKESDFNEYSSQNYEAINQFLKDHPDYQNGVTLSEK